MSNPDLSLIRRQLDRIEAAGGGNGTTPPSGTWRASVDARLEGLRGSVDGLRWIVGIVAVIMIGGFSFLGFQLNRVEGRADRVETAVAAIPARLSEEFHAMRSEMAAQTSAIATSITATRQAQPAPPQIIVVPAPQSGGQPGHP